MCEDVRLVLAHPSRDPNGRAPFKGTQDGTWGETRHGVVQVASMSRGDSMRGVTGRKDYMIVVQNDVIMVSKRVVTKGQE